MTTWTAADLSLGEEELGFNGALVEILRSTVSVGDRKRIVLQGDVREMAPKLVQALTQEGVLKAN